MAGIVGVLVAMIIGVGAGRIGYATGLLDWPDPDGGRKRHSHVTPLVGGLAIILSFEIAAVLLIFLLPEDSALVDTQVMWVGLAAGFMAAVGLADDRLGLSPILRLLFTTTVLLIAIVEVPDFRVEFLRFTGVGNIIILPVWASLLFTMLCFIGLLNAVNMADGKNGLVITLAIVWTSVLFARNPAAFDPLLFSVAGCLIVLLYFNMRGVLFLGDGGSYGVSAIFGLLSVYAYNHSFASFGAEQVAIMFLVPVLDTVRLMVWRVKHGRSPFQGDRNHLHHYLHARWGWPEGLGVYALLVAVPNLLAVAFPELSVACLGLAILLYGLTLRLAAGGMSFSQGLSGETVS